MGRRRVNKTVAAKTSNPYPKCKYCNCHKDGRGFDKHFAACKVRFMAQHHMNAPKRRTPAPDLRKRDNSRALQNSSSNQEANDQSLRNLSPVEQPMNLDAFPQPESSCESVASSKFYSINKS
jgi:hypothetical protein